MNKIFNLKMKSFLSSLKGFYRHLWNESFVPVNLLYNFHTHNQWEAISFLYFKLLLQVIFVIFSNIFFPNPLSQLFPHLFFNPSSITSLTKFIISWFLTQHNSSLYGSDHVTSFIKKVSTCPVYPSRAGAEFASSNESTKPQIIIHIKSTHNAHIQN